MFWGGSVRTFVAAVCPPDHPVAGALLGELSTRQWRPVPAERRHLTLRFLGEVSADRVSEMADRLRAALEGMPAFTLTVAGLGAFPDLRHPEVLWLGCGAGKEQLVRLAAATARALDAGQERDPRPFRAHLTVARRRPGTPAEEAAAALGRRVALWQQTEWGRLTVDRVELLASELHPDGARYTPLCTIGLALP